MRSRHSTCIVIHVISDNLHNLHKLSAQFDIFNLTCQRQFTVLRSIYDNSGTNIVNLAWNAIGKQTDIISVWLLLLLSWHIKTHLFSLSYVFVQKSRHWYLLSLACWPTRAVCFQYKLMLNSLHQLMVSIINRQHCHADSKRDSCAKHWSLLIRKRLRSDLAAAMLCSTGTRWQDVTR